MARRKAAKRRYQTITFKAFEDSDRDILDWWEGIEEGERSDALRDLIRVYLGKQPRRNKTLNIPELVEVRQDTLWIRDTLNDMPAYLERMMQYVAAQSAAQGAMHPQAQTPLENSVLQPNEAALTSSDKDRRARRMKRSQW